MDPKLLKIKISKFKTDRKFCREIFLDMPSNEKMIRIISIGDELRPSLLERLRKKEVEYLLARISDNEPNDPERVQLYVDEPSPLALAPASVQAPLAKTPEQPKPPIIEAAPLEASKSAITENPEKFLAEAGRKFSPALEDGAKTTIRTVDDQMDEAALKFSSLGEEENTQKIVNGVTDIQTNSARNVENHEEEEGLESFRADTNLEEASRGTSTSSAPENTLEESKVDPDAPAEAQAAEPEKKADQYRSANQAVIKEEERLLAEAKKAMWLEAAAKMAQDAHENTDDPESQLLAQTFEDAIERVLAGGPIPKKLDLEKSFATALENFAATIAAGSSASELEKIFIAADQALKEHETIVKAAPIPEIDHDEEIPIAKTTDNRRVPVMAGRLAPFLAHSLGYVQPEFLADLTLAIILRFSQRAGQRFDESQLPANVAAILDETAGETGSPLGDSREILALLEAYLQNPHYAPPERDFGDQIFDSTLKELGSNRGAINPWNQARWQQMAHNIVPIDTYSRCTRAANVAVLAAKKIFSQ